MTKKPRKPKPIDVDRVLAKQQRMRKNHDVVDMDYLDDLSPEEREFMAKFVAEYYYGTFNHSKPLTRKGPKRRKAYRDNNARNRDVWAQLGRVWFGDEHEWGDDGDD